VVTVEIELTLAGAVADADEVVCELAELEMADAERKLVDADDALKDTIELVDADVWGALDDELELAGTVENAEDMDCELAEAVDDGSELDDAEPELATDVNDVNPNDALEDEAMLDADICDAEALEVITTELGDALLDAAREDEDTKELSDAESEDELKDDDAEVEAGSDEDTLVMMLAEADCDCAVDTREEIEPALDELEGGEDWVVEFVMLVDADAVVEDSGRGGGELDGG